MCIMQDTLLYYYIYMYTNIHTIYIYIGTRYACKVILKDTKMNDAQSMSTEIEIMKRIRHRHVVAMYELFESPSCLWLILG